jgi:hypothetical protein
VKKEEEAKGMRVAEHERGQRRGEGSCYGDDSQKERQAFHTTRYPSTVTEICENPNQQLAAHQLSATDTAGEQQG